MESLVLLIAMFLAMLTPPQTTIPQQYTQPISEPTRIVIPSISVDSTIIPVGINSKGGMEVPPYEGAGWYKLGPVPGAEGPSVIVGHVSSKGRKGVFYDLKKLETGDNFYVYGKDGKVAKFVVDWSETTLKTELPADRIWSDVKIPVIRLVTCGGEFDKKTRHYLSNVIVYGHLVRN